jgi:succinate dehydrogenase / fumarate reductase cytochrome b subunit
MSALISTVRESLRYRGRAGQWMWVLHRLTGLGVLLFLIVHVAGMASAFISVEIHDQLLELYKTPLFSIGELGLAFALIFHAVNGTRVAILELKPELWSKQEVAARWAIIITILLAAPTILIMAISSFNAFFGPAGAK